MIKTEFPYSDNQNLNSKVKVKNSHNIVASNDELKQLWIACYFERRMSKPLVQSMDLKHTLRVIRGLVNQGTIDFRVVAPLVFGLAKILYRKMSYLLNETNSTLESLKNPFEEDDENAGKDNDGKSSRKRQNKDKKQRGDNFQHRPKNFIDLTNVKYPGLNQDAIEQLQDALEKDYKDFQQRGNIKNEEQSLDMDDFQEIRAGIKMGSSVKKEDNEDIRTFHNQTDDFINDIGLQLNETPQVMRNAGIENQYQNNLNITNDLLNLANEFGQDFGPIDFQNDIELNQNLEDNKNVDIFFGDLNLNSEEIAIKPKERVQKNNIKQIKQAMMKYDKNIQMARNIPLRNVNQEDDEDVVKSMANLILNYDDKLQRLEKSLLTTDTGIGSNLYRPSINVGSIRAEVKKTSKMMVLNPATESFLTFNLPNEKTLNATFLKEENPFNLTNNDIQPMIFGNEQQELNFSLQQSPIQSAFQSKQKESLLADVSPQLMSKDLHNDISVYESKVYQRSQDTLLHIQQIANNNPLPVKFEAIPQGSKEKVMQSFIDLLFLNSRDQVSLNQDNPLAFSSIAITVPVQ